MTDAARRSALNSEVDLLRGELLEFARDATFVGWTPQTRATYRDHLVRLEQLYAELAALDITKG